MKKTTLLLALLLMHIIAFTEDGYKLWLRYDKINNSNLLASYKYNVSHINFKGQSPTLLAAKEELKAGLKGLLGISTNFSNSNTTLLIEIASTHTTPNKLKTIGEEGYLLFRKNINAKNTIVLTANSDKGILYGVFHF